MRRGEQVHMRPAGGASHEKSEPLQFEVGTVTQDSHDLTAPFTNAKCAHGRGSRQESAFLQIQVSALRTLQSMAARAVRKVPGAVATPVRPCTQGFGRRDSKGAAAAATSKTKLPKAHGLKHVMPVRAPKQDLPWGPNHTL